MRMTTTLGVWALAAALGAAPDLGAATLQDWKQLKPGVNAGTYADKAGTQLSISAAEGPVAGEGSLRIEGQIVQWGGAWAQTMAPLGKGEGIRLQAKSSGPQMLSVMLADSANLQVEHRVRLSGDGWQAFELPLSSFTKTEWQDPAAPAGGTFQVAKLQSLSFSPMGVGHGWVQVGPVAVVERKAKLVDGQMGPDDIQDFVGLEGGAYGSFVDAKGSTMRLDIKHGAPGTERVAGLLDYDLKTDGWCGEWIRAGSAWTGQDWKGAKAVLIEAWCAEPVVLQLAFNDANQNAYIADAEPLPAGHWKTLKLPLKAFQLNPYYQPPQAKKGAPQDLSHVETFNLSPRSQGKHKVWVKKVSLQR